MDSNSKRMRSFSRMMLRSPPHSIHQQGDIRLGDDLVIKQQVPQLPAALRIVDGIVQAELFEQSRFPPARPTLVAARADDVHFDFARGVATETRAVVDEDHAGAVA